MNRRRLSAYIYRKYLCKLVLNIIYLNSIINNINNHFNK